MSLNIGIVGLANVGKSTLFEALTKKQVNISNYPFCTIDPNVGVVEVPDERLDKLAQLFHSVKKIPTIIEFVDIAGLVRNANKGEGLGNQFLASIREVDAILFVVRCFENSEIIHIEKTVDPLRDIDIVNTELILKDLETIQKRIDNAEADAKAGKVIVDELDILRKIEEGLERGKLAIQIIKENGELFKDESPVGKENQKTVKSLQLLTSKPIIFVLNSDKNSVSEELEKRMKELNSEYIMANLRDEYDGTKFTEEERRELGLSGLKLNQIIEKSYKVLNLITFFTTGPDETRAWTTKKGTLAPKAAGAIHTDFENKFICLDVINWEKLVKIAEQNQVADAWAAAARSGQLKTQGKEYVIQDGDVMVVKHAP